MTKFALLGIALLGSAVAFAAEPARKPAKPAKPAAETAPVAPPPVDRAALTEQVRATELAFAKTVADDDIEKWASYIDPDAVFVSGMTVTRGVVAVIESWKGSFGPNRPYFEWHPEVVELSPDATFALSRGPWTIRTTDKKGRVKEVKGVFNSIWRRQLDGSWKIVFDAGCPPCPDCR
jgi:ketosteroid isomerase-like protein